MGTGPISNDDNKMPLGKEYWAQQAENNLNNDGKSWKAPDGSDNVPVGKTEAEVTQTQKVKNDNVINWKDIPNVIMNAPLVFAKLYNDFLHSADMNPDRTKTFYNSGQDIINDLKK